MNLSAEDPFLFSTRSEIPEFLLRETRQKIHLHQIKLCRTWYHVIPVLVQALLGIFGNILILAVFAFRARHTRTSAGLRRCRVRDPASCLRTTDIYLAGVAIADLILSLSYVSFCVTQSVENLELTSLFCKVQEYLLYLGFYLSAFLLCVVSIWRMQSVVSPKAFMHFSQRRVAVGFTVGIFVSVALMSVPSLKLYEASSSGQCMMAEEYREAGAWIFFVMDSIVGYAFPGCLIVVCNVVTIVAIQRQKCRSAGRGEQSFNADERRSYDQATLRILMVTSAFCILLLPWQVLHILNLTNAETSFAAGNEIPYIAFILYQTNSSINFLLYCLSGPSYRDDLKTLFRRKLN